MAKKFLDYDGLEEVVTQIKSLLLGYEPTISLTSSKAVATDSNGKLTTSETTSTELGYLSGVTSAIQTQLNSKQATLTAGDNITIETINNVLTISAQPGVREITELTNMWQLDSGVYVGRADYFKISTEPNALVSDYVGNYSTSTAYPKAVVAINEQSLGSDKFIAFCNDANARALIVHGTTAGMIESYNAGPYVIVLQNVQEVYTSGSTQWDTTPTSASTNAVTSGGVYSALSGKQDTLTFDTEPTDASTNPVTSGGVYTALGGKVDKVTGKGLSTDDFVSANYYTKTQVDGIVSAVYKPAGSVAFASLPTLAEGVLGNVYNVTDAFTTTSDFVEGAGNEYPAGTNVAVVNTGTNSSPTYKFDVLAGFVDLSGYVPTTRTINNKALSADITLTASDVGALPSNTTYVSSVNGSTGAVTGIQTTANIVTSFNSTTSDSKYPSEKLVKTSLDAKQDAMTEITTAEIDALFN